MKMFRRLQNWFRRWRYQEGTTLSRFIACDIRRDILIVSAAKVEQGIIVGRIRTTNLLYLSGGLIPKPEFEPERELRIDEMWHWTGQPWGGLPDGTSIADPVHRETGCRREHDDGQQLPDSRLPSSGVLSHAVRFAFAAIGAFFLGVLLGVFLVYEIARTAHVFLGIAEIVGLHILFSSLGSLCGIVLFRLLSWSKPSGTDVGFVLGNGLLFGLLGFAYLVSLIPGT